jgi:uncharacterized DUF497 family protein
LPKAPAARGICIAEVTRRIRGSRAEYIDSVYTLRYNSKVANGIEFDWDAENTKHLAAHKVTAREFESVMQNSPLDLAYEVVDGEERYRSVGMTDSGRLLVAIWTLRDGKVRAVTAFPASATYKKLFPERKR